MTESFSKLCGATKQMKNIYTPVFIKTDTPSGKQTLDNLIKEGKVSYIHDEIYNQLQELIKIKNPSVRIKPEDYEGMITGHLAGKDINEYGIWVYYPWSGRLVHILDEEEFIEIRTNRNKYKITRAEQNTLSSKRIGVVGLSVGQYFALTLAMERSCGELRLADFDTLDLSNLNRIRSGVHNLGVLKVVITAREIAEIDPFLKVTCFFDGLQEANMDEFFTQNGKLDLLVEECDQLDIKVLARYKARELRIPVLMDTSDRGMLDVERFDLEPERAVLHGTIENVDPHNIQGLSTEEKIPVMLQMLGIGNISLRAKVSMLEVEQSINTWPQLASSVVLGGAIGADVCRRILLDQFHESGRYYIDLEKLIGNKKASDSASFIKENPFSPLSVNEMRDLADKAGPVYDPNDITPDHNIINKLVAAAIAAPSTGNDQPWKWLYKNGTLYLYHDEYRSYSFGDFRKTASFITFGAAYENLYIHALSLGIEPYYSLFPNSSNERIVASIRFKKLEHAEHTKFLEPLDQAIFKRHTNRNLAPKAVLEQDIFDKLSHFTESIPGAKFQYFTEDSDVRGLAKIIGSCDRIRLLNPEGHYDFVHREMRWTSSDAELTGDGIDIKTLGLDNSQLAALGVIKNENVIRSIKEIGGGNALGMLALRTISTASALCLITLPKYDLNNFFEGGRSMERFWLAATNLNLAVHPLISPLYLFSRTVHGDGEGLDEKSILELQLLRDQFNKITKLDDSRAEVFLTKIAIADEPLLKAHRLPLKDILVIEG